MDAARRREAAVAGLVLAAGAGTRYGQPKILVPGWLDAAVDALRSGGCADVRVVTGAARVPMPAGAAEVHCPEWARGMGASLRAGLTSWESHPNFVVVQVVDCPDIGAVVVRRVLAAADHGHVARAVFDGRPGHPVVFPRRQIPALLAALNDDAGAATFLAGRTDLLRVECADLATGTDVDRPTHDLGSRTATAGRSTRA